MKHSQLKEYREKDTNELNSLIKELSVKLTSAYLARSAGKLHNVSMIKNLKLEIARLKTIIRERELEMV